MNKSILAVSLATLFSVPAIAADNATNPIWSEPTNPIEAVPEQPVLPGIDNSVPGVPDRPQPPVHVQPPIEAAPEQPVLPEIDNGVPGVQKDHNHKSPTQPPVDNTPDRPQPPVKPVQPPVDNSPERPTPQASLAIQLKVFHLNHQLITHQIVLHLTTVTRQISQVQPTQSVLLH